MKDNKNRTYGNLDQTGHSRNISILADVRSCWTHPQSQHSCVAAHAWFSVTLLTVVISFHHPIRLNTTEHDYTMWDEVQ